MGAHRHVCFTVLLMRVIDHLIAWRLPVPPTPGQARRSSLCPLHLTLGWLLVDFNQWKGYCDFPSLFTFLGSSYHVKKFSLDWMRDIMEREASWPQMSQPYQ